MGVIVLDASSTNIQIAETSRKWTFTGDGEIFRLLTEAQRIHYAVLRRLTPPSRTEDDGNHASGDVNRRSMEIEADTTTALPQSLRERLEKNAREHGFPPIEFHP
jgi:hypothetical protein